MSPERLARIDAMCEDAIEDNIVPGIVTLITRHGKIIHHKAFGMADQQTNRSLKKDDIFRIASQSKAITATAIMMLWEEGKFSLNDPISKFIPEFKNPTVLKDFRYSDTTYTTELAHREITIRHLLTHTSGIGYGIIDGDERFKMIYQKGGVTDLFTLEEITIGESVKKLAKLPLHFTPGERYAYSEGLDVLGYLVEIASGMPFDEFLATRLFEPLGMNDSYFYLPKDKHNRLVTVQKPEAEKWVKYTGTAYYDADYPIKGKQTFFSGGAGLLSTAKDYATFLQMYLNGGELNGTRILSRTTIQAIMGNQFPEIWEGSDWYYGLVFGVQTEYGQALGGNGNVGTFNWGGYFNTSYFADSKEGIIGIIMKQTRGQKGDYTSGRFRQLVGQAVDD
ncbi:UNVERIFIED_CONTAM: hypothetical protein GTU68_062560 [Idotea baltica]|nr:hypothetical protein [Idotea baltica]